MRGQLWRWRDRFAAGSRKSDCTKSGFRRRMSRTVSGSQESLYAPHHGRARIAASSPCSDNSLSAHAQGCTHSLSNRLDVLLHQHTCSRRRRQARGTCRSLRPTMHCPRPPSCPTVPRPPGGMGSTAMLDHARRTARPDRCRPSSGKARRSIEASGRRTERRSCPWSIPANSPAYVSRHAAKACWSRGRAA